MLQSNRLRRRMTALFVVSVAWALFVASLYSMTG